MIKLSILSTDIRSLKNLYSLNDLHKAAGSLPRHKPSNFLRIDQTQELITEIEQCSDMRTATKTINGGKERGTYACKEVVYAYAMWISAKFNLHVIHAFDEAQSREISGPRRPQVTEVERYALANSIIQQLDLDDNPVLIPYIELVNLIGVMRHYQNTVDQLHDMEDRVNTCFEMFMRVSGGKHFGLR